MFDYVSLILSDSSLKTKRPVETSISRLYFLTTPLAEITSSYTATDLASSAYSSIWLKFM